MKIGDIGLGKMGKNMVLNLLDHKHKVVAYNRSPGPVKDVARRGAVAALTVEEMVGKLPNQKIVWIMVPAGKPVDMVLGQLLPHLKRGDIVIDGGNSFYKDSVRRAKKIEKKGIMYVDVGVSGGPGGARRGACLMIGGNKKIFEKLRPIFRDISVKNGYQFFPGSGAGHFVKMVHNGIEYGIMQAIAEGFDIMKRSKYKLDMESIADIYNHGSVIESNLMDWMKNAFEQFGGELKGVSGAAQESGEGRWTVQTAKELKVRNKVLSEALKSRSYSRKKPNYQGKIIQALRNRFGGHELKK